MHMSIAICSMTSKLACSRALGNTVNGSSLPFNVILLTQGARALVMIGCFILLCLENCTGRADGGRPNRCQDCGADTPRRYPTAFAGDGGHVVWGSLHSDRSPSQAPRSGDNNPQPSAFVSLGFGLKLAGDPAKQSPLHGLLGQTCKELFRKTGARSTPPMRI